MDEKSTCKGLTDDEVVLLAKALAALAVVIHKRAKKAKKPEGKDGSTELFVQAAQAHMEAAKMFGEVYDRIKSQSDAAQNPSSQAAMVEARANEEGRAAYDYHQAAIREPASQVQEKTDEDRMSYSAAQEMKLHYQFASMLRGQGKTNGEDYAQRDWDDSENGPTTTDYAK